MGAHLEEALGGHVAIVRGKERINILGGSRTLKRKGMIA